jgi:hypothetical protein
MDQFERMAGWLTDMNWGWWPFLYLRPPPHVQLTTARVAKMAIHYGPLVGGALAMWLVASGQTIRGLGVTGSVLLSVGPISGDVHGPLLHPARPGRG